MDWLARQLGAYGRKLGQSFKGFSHLASELPCPHACGFRAPDTRPLNPAGDCLLCFLAALACCLCLCSTGCREQPPSSAVTGGAIAVVGTQAISPEAFLAQLARAPVGGKNIDEVKQRVLEEMIQSEARYQRALAAGYDKRPEVAAEIERMIATRFEQDELSRLGTAEVTHGEVADYYARNVARYTTPAAARVAVIEFKIPRSATDAKRAEAIDRASGVLREALMNNAADGTFGVLAQLYSEHLSSRYRGGQVGWIVLGTNNTGWPCEMVQALEHLAAPGDISPVIESAEGIYLLKLLEKQPARIRPLEEVRDGVEYLVRRQKQAEQHQQLSRSLKEGIDIQVNEPLLESITLPAKEPPLPGMFDGQGPTTGANHEERTREATEPGVPGK